MNDTSKLIISKPIVFIDSEIGADDKKYMIECSTQ